jgi:cob(I)alamin adenosyltransferase
MGLFMKIYTKTGDNGDTSLFGGHRIPKSSLRIDACGAVDELNAHLGVIRALKPPAEVENILEQLQNQLFILGADLAAPLNSASSKIQRIQQDHISNLEKIIDNLDVQLRPLQSFILPGGQLIGAQIHVARTVCRRAERLLDALGRKEDIGKFPLVYLNRLADLLFVLARYVNNLSGIEESKWKGCTKTDIDGK